MRKPAVTDTSVVYKLLRESLQTIYLLFSKAAKWDPDTGLTWHAAKHTFSRLDIYFILIPDHVTAEITSCPVRPAVLCGNYSILPWCSHRGKKIGPGLFEVSHELTQSWHNPYHTLCVSWSGQITSEAYETVTPLSGLWCVTVWWWGNENTNFDPRWWRYGHMKLLTFWCWMIVSNDPNGVTNSGFWLVSQPRPGLWLALMPDADHCEMAGTRVTDY